MIVYIKTILLNPEVLLKARKSMYVKVFTYAFNELHKQCKRNRTVWPLNCQIIQSTEKRTPSLFYSSLKSGSRNENLWLYTFISCEIWGFQSCEDSSHCLL